MRRYYQVSTSYMCCLIETNVIKLYGTYNEIVIDSPPIMNWAKGKHIEAIKKWVNEKRGTITQLYI